MSITYESKHTETKVIKGY